MHNMYICIYIYICILSRLQADSVSGKKCPLQADSRPVHLLRVSLFRVLESNFPGDSL